MDDKNTSLLDDKTTCADNEYAGKHKPFGWSRRVLLEMEILLSEFETYLFREGLAKTTIRKYLKDTKQFFKEKGILSVTDLSRESINDWVLTLRNKNCTVGTIAAHLWALKSFLSFVEQDKRVHCYKWDVRIPFVPSPETVEFLELDELDIIFAAIDTTTIRGARIRALIELMINTGMRPSEALKLTKDDLASRPEELEIIGKGSKRRPVYFNERVYYWLDLYLSQRSDDHPSLFVIHNGKEKTRALKLRNAEFAFQQLMIKSGIKKRIVLHTLRHTFATQYMAKGCPADYVARLLGHSSTKTTRKYYLAVNQKHAKKAYFHFNPFGNGNSHEIDSGSPVQFAPALN